MNELHTKSNKITRRGFLEITGATAAVLMGSRRTVRAEETPSTPSAFRFVHLTDIHVQPELKAGEGFRKCLAAVHDLKPRPDFILTGGDLVMDILEQSPERARMLFDLYTSIIKDSDIPFHQCVGNHDVFGWGPKGKVTSDHVSYGKKMVQERLSLDKTTYSFDHKGWYFCVVDDIQPHKGGGYEGGFSEEDMHWLKGDLAATKGRPTVMCLHMPIIAVAVFRAADATGAANIEVPTHKICRNTGPILKMLRDHRVKLVLSGHLHENETIHYDHTTHIEDGAVCGAWWKGPHNGNPEGFGIIDARSDGTFEHTYHTYGWKAEVPVKRS